MSLENRKPVVLGKKVCFNDRLCAAISSTIASILNEEIWKMKDSCGLINEMFDFLPPEIEEKYRIFYSFMDASCIFDGGKALIPDVSKEVVGEFISDLEKWLDKGSYISSSLNRISVSGTQSQITNFFSSMGNISKFKEVFTKKLIKKFVEASLQRDVNFFQQEIVAYGSDFKYGVIKYLGYMIVVNFETKKIFQMLRQNQFGLCDGIDGDKLLKIDHKNSSGKNRNGYFSLREGKSFGLNNRVGSVQQIKNDKVFITSKGVFSLSLGKLILEGENIRGVYKLGGINVVSINDKTLINIDTLESIGEGCYDLVTPFAPVQGTKVLSYKIEKSEYYVGFLDVSNGKFVGVPFPFKIGEGWEVLFLNIASWCSVFHNPYGNPFFIISRFGAGYRYYDLIDIETGKKIGEISEKDYKLSIIFRDQVSNIGELSIEKRCRNGYKKADLIDCLDDYNKENGVNGELLNLFSLGSEGYMETKPFALNAIQLVKIIYRNKKYEIIDTVNNVLLEKFDSKKYYLFVGLDGKIWVKKKSRKNLDMKPLSAVCGAGVVDHN